MFSKGLIKDDDEWKHCLNEASQFRFPAALRSMFASILLFCNPKYPRELFELFKDNLSEDYLRTNPPGLAYQLTLASINRHLMQDGKSLANFSDMPPLQLLNLEENVDYMEEGKKLNNFMNP